MRLSPTFRISPEYQGRISVIVVCGLVPILLYAVQIVPVPFVSVCSARRIVDLIRAYPVFHREATDDEQDIALLRRSGFFAGASGQQPGLRMVIPAGGVGVNACTVTTDHWIVGWAFSQFATVIRSGLATHQPTGRVSNRR